MTTFHLGVVDIAYTEDGKSATTGKVAGILEANYGVMRTFLELHEQDIADAVAKQFSGMLENAKMGAPLNYGVVIFPEIHAEFAEYLDTGEWERTSGQIVAAAQAGHRSTNKSIMANKKGSRVAFVDTHTYKNAMQAWLSK